MGDRPAAARKHVALMGQEVPRSVDRCAKVANCTMFVFGEQHIVGFEVDMYDSQGVKVIQTVGLSRKMQRTKCKIRQY